MSEVEDRLKRIQAHKGVIGVIVVNNEGNSYGGMKRNDDGLWSRTEKRKQKKNI